MENCPLPRKNLYLLSILILALGIPHPLPKRKCSQEKRSPSKKETLI
jgi:hypothetical protein